MVSFMKSYTEPQTLHVSPYCADIYICNVTKNFESVEHVCLFRKKDTFFTETCLQTQVFSTCHQEKLRQFNKKW